MKNVEPLVSIYLPTYNRLNLLKRAVQSVLDQRYKSVELLIVDDGSIDGTREYIESLTIRYPFIKNIKKSGSKGAPASRNTAISSAQGKYITGLDDDDYFSPFHIEMLVSSYRKEFAFVFPRKFNWKDILFSTRCAITRTVCINQLLFFNIVGNQVLTETYKIQRISGFDESFEAAQDYDTWLRLMEEYGPAKMIYADTYHADSSHIASRISHNKNAKIKAYNDIASRYRNKFIKGSFRLREKKLGANVDVPLYAILDGRNLRHLLSSRRR